MAKKATITKPKTTKQTVTKKSKSTLINDDVIRSMIQEEAYFLAERRGFQGGSQDQDWFEAEKIVRKKLK